MGRRKKISDEQAPVKNIENEEMFKKKQIKGKYVGFHTRILISIVTFAILLGISFLLVMMSFSKINEQTVDYQESSDVKYKVFLNDNTYWPEEYLESGNNNIYISPLIKKIQASFSYNFDISEKSDLDFTYYVVGKIVIQNESESKEFYSKEYKLTTEKHEKVLNSKSVRINEEIDVDYEYYNELANRIRQEYGINTKSYFEVTIYVNGEEMKDKFDLNLDYNRSIKIPLAEREVDIKVDDNKVSNIHKTITKNKYKVNNILYIVIGAVSFVVAVICLIKLVISIKVIFVPKKSKYDKYVKRILREYDRLIVDTVTPPDLNNMRIIKVEQFPELLDVRDNLKLPIKYYVVTEHQKCVFYVTHLNEIYVLTIKAVDLEK